MTLQQKHFLRSPEGDLEVRVEGTLARVTEKGRTRMRWQPPKTDAGYRTVPVFQKYRPLISGHLEKFTRDPDDYATTNTRGGVLLDNSFRAAFNKARDTAGSPAEITPHYGRNWLITRLAEVGATPKEIGAVLGQEDVSTIVGTYMRVREHRPGELMGRIKPED